MHNVFPVTPHRKAAPRTSAHGSRRTIIAVYHCTSTYYNEPYCCDDYCKDNNHFGMTKFFFICYPPRRTKALIANAWAMARRTGSPFGTTRPSADRRHRFCSLPQRGNPPTAPPAAWQQAYRCLSNADKLPQKRRKRHLATNQCIIMLKSAQPQERQHVRPRL